MLKKKYVYCSLLVGSILLAACGSDNDTETGDQGTSDSGKTEIEIAWRGTGEGDNVRRYLEKFQEEFEAENDDIDIVLAPVTASEGDYFSRMALTMQSSETAPDIVSEDTFMLSSDANAGYLKNLDDHVAEWEEWDNFIENIKEGTTGEDGSTYGIPTTTDSRGIWYSKEVFEEAGLPEDWQPTSWDDIYDAAEQIADSGSEAIPFSMNVAKVNGEATSMQTFEMLLYGTGETLYDSETQVWNVNGQGLVDSLTFIDEIMNQRNLGPSLSIALNSNYGSTLMQDLLPNAGVGMVLDGSWNIGNYLEGGVAELDDPESVLGFALFPGNGASDDEFITMAGGWSWAIPENSQNHEESWRVIQAMSTMESQARRAVLEGTLTVRNDSAEDEAYLERPMIETATEALEYSHFRPKSDLYPNISIAIQDAVESVATGSATPEEAAENYRNAVISNVGEENTN
ncbi:extracellular solute-binding protein [Marinilactibacillus sp. GCM10026970]|uniref:extracellular solute-binding protein n=1 Tax=Marinilactibacillus sp. GCM10026970 TaxID=3252642 RepID=UPI0036234E44